MQDNSTSSAPFSGKSIFWLVFVGLLATMGIAVTSVFQGDGQYETSTGADSFSKSAIGHAALVSLLREDGWSIVQSQHNTPGKLGADTALLILEPRYNLVNKTTFKELMGHVPTLFVLPKRTGLPDSTRKGWISRQLLMDVAAPKRELRFAVEAADLVRPKNGVHNWHTPIFDGHVPDISDIQLIQSKKVEPVIWGDEGILLGKIKGRGGAPVWILSDPDILATHGLNRGWNADFAVGIVKMVSHQAGTLVIDEVLHGHLVEPSLARAMFRSPFVYATLALLAALSVFLLTFTRRFGAPFRQLREPQHSKAVFLQNSARLLEMAEKEHEALLRLLDDTALNIAQRLNVRADLERHRLEAWLDERARLMGVVPDFSTLKRRLQMIREDDDTRRRRLLIISNQIYTWKREILRDAK
ncbi:hypothetical protein [Kordiimonas marina]|uniref:hypothetical protein n=1 Tax=Kordiimonas marina TaxID=2872312 RepID=UPI001FF6CAB4|nr:hypothetical protein [Kordiimonas marina]MCJ9427542.1 hypothetical protein [Kordiimonas marina]